MRYDWKKNDKAIYLPRAMPTPVTLPRWGYCKVSGRGNPASEIFQHAVEMLYTLSYTVKNLHKTNPDLPGWYDYAVFPLEGAWFLPPGADPGDKENFIYDLMIRQPDYLSDGVQDAALAAAAAKKPHLPWRSMEWLEQEEGECVQMLHVGPYEEEARSFSLLDAFLREKGLARRGDGHKEIYLSDPQRTAPEKRKTVLRYWVREGANPPRGARMVRGRHG